MFSLRCVAFSSPRSVLDVRRRRRASITNERQGRRLGRIQVQHRCNGFKMDSKMKTVRHSEVRKKEGRRDRNGHGRQKNTQEMKISIAAKYDPNTTGANRRQAPKIES